MLTDNTPIERHADNVWVKREDLCSPDPGPGFAKIRGVLAHIRSRPESLIGVLDTFHSKAGWAVTYCCRALSKNTLNFYPHYKADEGQNLRRQQALAYHMGAELRALRAGRSAVLYHDAKRQTTARGGYMMPNALKLPETVEECRAEVVRTGRVVLERFDCLVLSVSSGTIAAGVLLGFQDLGLAPNVVLHLGYDRSEEELRRYMVKHGATLATGAKVVNEGFGYKDPARGAPAPFPCNPYYDLKAWRWLMANRQPGDVLFWNIGD